MTLPLSISPPVPQLTGGERTQYHSHFVWSLLHFFPWISLAYQLPLVHLYGEVFGRNISCTANLELVFCLVFSFWAGCFTIYKEVGKKDILCNISWEIRLIAMPSLAHGENWYFKQTWIEKKVAHGLFSRWLMHFYTNVHLKHMGVTCVLYCIHLLFVWKNVCISLGTLKAVLFLYSVL